MRTHYLVTGLLIAALASEALAAKDIESLLKASEMMYTKDKDGSFNVMVSIEGDASLVVVSETGFGTEANMKLVYLWSLIKEVPKGYHHPPALLKKIAELNDQFVVGKVSVNAETGHVFYNSSFWLRTADAEVVVNELVLAHVLRQQAKKDLLPFFQE